ncbi:hypothetical protein [Acinetobacter puyangensis]|uniref:hypothetical protein n=1 Tax=Acinetobacter puyangensis TaxID=1096779 RepID=UPI003A4D1ED2
MKFVGLLVVIIGIILIGFSITMNTSVPTDYGDRINNIGLMADRQNYIIVSCLIFITGFITAIVGIIRSDQKAPSKVTCNHCGEIVYIQSTKPSEEKYIIFRKNLGTYFKDFIIWLILLGIFGIGLLALNHFK